MGVIISLILDDGEEQRLNIENLFKDDYNKVGIAYCAHQTEFQICVMDFAEDYSTLEGNNNVIYHLVKYYQILLNFVENYMIFL